MNRFTFKSMSYPVENALENILSKCLLSGIKSVYSKSSFDIEVEFKNGFTMKAWNENRYYAWLNSGCFYYPDGKTYQWSSGRPKRKTMSDFYNALSSFSTEPLTNTAMSMWRNAGADLSAKR